ncbi:glycosyl hydrolase [Actomonas aquatica]|uniref:Glycosyl hydrolase n=1 Tax=Actomonas aquatica TaxID=2866162 RepID=A0ABZ1C9B2_9BACT|nr:glycosyl hydrolase [Opitutus sp. WL0086]WRQ88287.1 glycosyl hydrolase [Opitutus sp. WL0086]
MPRPRFLSPFLSLAVGLAGIVVCLAPVSTRAAEPFPELAAGFAAPPPETRPWAFWFWMNGNVSREGITRDIEAMAAVGMGGVMAFDGGDYLPQGPATYLGEEWRSLMAHAISEGNRLGIEIGMHNAPGWSSSGGPWITPELAMQQLVWSETTVVGGHSVDLALAQPQINEGYYRDIAVLAFPAPAAETTPYLSAIERVTVSDGRTIDPAILADGSWDTKVELKAGDALDIVFAEPVALHALTAQPTRDGRFPNLQFEASIDGTDFAAVTRVSSPGRHGIIAPAVRSFETGAIRVARFTATRDGELGDLALHRTPRVSDWVAKANFDYRVSGQLKLPTPVSPTATIDPAAVLDLTAQVNDGRLQWDAPAGAWIVLRLGQTPTGKTNVAASVAGTGLECDKFNPAAVDRHFNTVIKQVMADATAVGAKGPATLTIDSYEAGMQNWTAAMPAEFAARAGYDLRPYLPALTGRIVGDAGVSERFLYDFRRVQAQLMAEHYYGRMGEHARAHGLRFFIEGYGPGNFDELQVAGLPDVPTTEFWARTPWTPNRVVKMVTSAAHVYGKPVVAAESFTGWSESARWLGYPYAFKALGDEMFAHGMNHIVFHRWAHQPHPTAGPGMAQGPYGSHIERTNTWFLKSSEWINTIARSQFLLRQGTYAADVLYFIGERSPDPSQYAMPVLPPGYTYDLINAEALLNRITVRDGAYTLPEGGRYRLLVLPDNLRAMSPTVLAKLREFVAAGGTVLGPKPEFSPTLTGYPQSETHMLAMADALWAQGDRVWTGLSIGEALQRLELAPDVTWTGPRADTALSWAHRRLDGADLFFIGNKQRAVEDLTLSLRDMAGREPQLWWPESGRHERLAVYSNDGDRTLVPLRLEPSESVFVLLPDAVEPIAAAAATLTRDGQPVLAATTVAPEALDVHGDFTMAIWVKPDTNLRVMPKESTTGRIDEVGKFYAIPADPGDVRFGAGHATAGLAVGRNGIFVVERATESCPAVLVWEQPVSGWTHVAVVYRDGVPELYVNGAHVHTGLKSGAIVHSGVGAPPPPVDYMLSFPGIERLTRAAGERPPPSRGVVYYFEGNTTPALSVARALEGAELAQQFAAGAPPLALPVVSEVSRDTGSDTADRVSAVVWQSGAYALDDGATTVVDVATPITLDGAWTVAFQADRGAPDSITLPALQSLHRHADFGVKHFAGTASYRHSVDVPEAWLASDRRVVLDLGRVEVIAEVSLNGRPVGNVWKEPYRLDVTDFVHAGVNELDVQVTTLWPNRLIGDEFLPVEDHFGRADERGVEAGGIGELPDWYKRGEPKPAGGRVSFATWKFYDKDEPLLASGLLGPVRLLNPVRVGLR